MNSGPCAPQDCTPCCVGPDRATDTVRVEAFKLKVDWEAEAQAAGAGNLQVGSGQLLWRLRTRLLQEGLELSDLPDAATQEFLLILVELGFDRALERTKLRKAVKELLVRRDTATAAATFGAISHRSARSLADDLCSEASSEFLPALGAYYTGETAEFFDRAQHCWLRAEVTAEPRAPGKEAVYSVTVLPEGSVYQGISLSALRPPLREGEPCEVFSQEGRWLQAVTTGLCQGLGTSLHYEVWLVEQDGGGVVQAPTSSIRRRFPPGSLVGVYLGAGLGWANAMVVSGQSQVGQPGSASEPWPPVSRAATEDGGPEGAWFTEVSICMETGETSDPMQQVPSYLLRFRQEYLEQYAMWSPAREEATLVSGGSAGMLLKDSESFVVSMSQRDKVPLA